MPKRNCKFTDELKKEYLFMKKVCGQVDRVKCEVFVRIFSFSWLAP
jgi:hypothetical protein